MTPFQHFFSDPHFGHTNIIGHAQRPFRDVDHMNAELEDRYSTVVRNTDTVLWVGDVSFADALWTADLLRRLPGRKVLVRGNHDGTLAHCLKLGFEVVVDYLHITIAGHKITCSHYPPAGGPDARYLDRRPPKPGPNEFVLHGHTHQRTKRTGRLIHVGVDAWHFTPASIEEITDLVTQ